MKGKELAGFVQSLKPKDRTMFSAFMLLLGLGAVVGGKYLLTKRYRSGRSVQMFLEIASGIRRLIERNPNKIYVRVSIEDLSRACGVLPGVAYQRGYRLRNARGIRSVARDILGKVEYPHLEVWRERGKKQRYLVATALAVEHLLKAPTVRKGHLVLPNAIMLVWNKPPKNRVLPGIEGEVYFQSEPGATPFVKVGDLVKAGDPLFIILASKVRNYILALRPMRIVRVLVVDGAKVGAEESIFQVEYLDEGGG
ncbi:MAG: acetyl-CoA carboxylase biotin carboxyl carrier protein [Candidatus Berkelbacteria bacterium]|nr:acetyl-CoA carboxylase biotin carboxyl carrier protein [Candidatus Berkelbacteria bacterium]